MHDNPVKRNGGRKSVTRQFAALQAVVFVNPEIFTACIPPYRLCNKLLQNLPQANGAIIYAPTSLNTQSGVIMNPKRLSYLQAGWKFFDLQPPVDPSPPSSPLAPASPSPTPKSPRSSPMPLPHKGTITTLEIAAFCHFPLFEKSPPACIFPSNVLKCTCFSIGVLCP